MKTNYVYAAIVVVIIILGFIFMRRDKNTKQANTNPIEMATTTDSTTISVSPSATTQSSKPTTSTISKPSAGTNTTKPVQTSPGMPPAPAAGTPTYSILNGSIVRLTSYNGVSVPADSKYTLAFDGSTLSAKFCNGLGGEYVLDGNEIKASNLVGTKMYCAAPDRLMEIETAFSNMLNFGATISIAGNTLILTSPTAVLVFTGFSN